MMNQTKKSLSPEEERSRKIWKYYDLTRLVLLVLMIAGLMFLCLPE